MSTPRLVLVGDTLLDRDLAGRASRLCPDAPVPVVEGITVRTRAGGAGLAAVLAARDGADVTLITALGPDDAGRSARDLLAAAGVRLIDAGIGGSTAEKVRVRVGAQTVVRLDHGDVAPTVGPLPGEARRALARADAVLVSDYGRGVAAASHLRSAITDLEAPVVWDPHSRGPSPVAGVTLLTPNAAEAASGAGACTPAEDAVLLLARTRARAVAVTLGAEGALLATDDGRVVAVPAPSRSGGDACGAGDRFATAATAALAGGAGAHDAVCAGVDAASTFVAAGGVAGTPPDRAVPLRAVAGCREAAARVRRDGGTVVAAGGCFDLLHVGHVAMMEAARALGDMLVVLINSDRSVRRLKGPERPLVAQDDRARMLAALRCVDAVEIFDEDTPERALAGLRPHIFAKGADYDVSRIPEARLMERLGGRVVGLPYIAGRSTTRLIQEVGERAAV